MSQPSLQLRINGTLLILACLFAAGVLLSTLAMPNMFLWMGAAVYSVAVLPLAWLQYRALSGGDLPHIDKLVSWLRVEIGCALLPLLFAGYEFLSRGVLPTAGYVFQMLLPAALIAAWLLYTLFLTVGWRKQFANSQTPAVPAGEPLAPAAPTIARNAQPWPGSRARAAGAALLAVWAGYMLGVKDSQPVRLMHVSPSETRLDLPAGASDVCIRTRYPNGTLYSFAIDEAGARQWGEELCKDVEPEAGYQFPEKRPGHWHSDHEDERERGQLKPVSGYYSILAATDDPAEPESDHVIKNGWYFDPPDVDYFRGPTFAYDADEGRAYFQGHGH